MEEDASLDYDPFLAAGVALASLSGNETDAECHFLVKRVRQTTSAQQKTSLLVKIIANLHCFITDICKEQERHLFLNTFIDCLRTVRLKSSSGICNEFRTVTARRNLGYLLEHARSLVSIFLSQEDIDLLSQFFKASESFLKLQELESIPPQESQIEKEVMSPLVKAQVGVMLEVPVDLCKSKDLEGKISESLNRLELSKATEDISLNWNVSERQVVSKHFLNIESNCSDFSSVSGNNSSERILDKNDIPKLFENMTEDEFSVAVEENEKEQTAAGDGTEKRKRKRNIMNDKQIALIEEALLDDPEMQRHTSLLQSLTNTLSSYGSELTTTQLKNWLNNRKARLLRAAKESKATSDGHITDRQDGSGPGHFYNSPESLSEEMNNPTTTTRREGNQNITNTATPGVNTTVPPELTVQHREPVRYVPRCKPGQYVSFLDGEGKEVGTGFVSNVEGWWYGINLKEMGLCVLHVHELKVDGRTELPHPSAVTGYTFEDSLSKLMEMRVVWDANKIEVRDMEH